MGIISIYGAMDCEECDKLSAIEEVIKERCHQDEQWGGPEHDDQHNAEDWMRFIAELLPGSVKHGETRYRRRLIEIAALAVAAIESNDRRCAPDPDPMAFDDIHGNKPEPPPEVVPAGENLALELATWMPTPVAYGVLYQPSTKILIGDDGSGGALAILDYGTGVLDVECVKCTEAAKVFLKHVAMLAGKSCDFTKEVETLAVPCEEKKK